MDNAIPIISSDLNTLEGGKNSGSLNVLTVHNLGTSMPQLFNILDSPYVKDN